MKVPKSAIALKEDFYHICTIKNSSFENHQKSSRLFPKNSLGSFHRNV